MALHQFKEVFAASWFCSSSGLTQSMVQTFSDDVSVLYIGKICCNIVYHCLVCSTCCPCSEARQKENNQRCVTWHGEDDASLMHSSKAGLTSRKPCNRSTEISDFRFQDVKFSRAYHGAYTDPQAGVLPVFPGEG